MSLNTTDTTPTTASQPTHENEGSCESEVAKLNTAQVAFLSKATSDCSHLTASRIFGDMEHETYTMLGDDDKRALMLAYENWNQNGNIAPDDLKAIEAGYFSGQAWVWSAYVAHLLPQLVAAHALDIDTFKSGASEMANQVKHLRERTLMAEAVRDSALARVSELVEAVKAERVAHAAYDEDGGDELLFTWANARQLTDMLVSKHEGAGEPITVEALEREGFENAVLRTNEYCGYWVKGVVCVMPAITSCPVWIQDAECEVAHVDNCHTMRDLHALVRLFTAPDAARARDVVADEGESAND